MGSQLFVTGALCGLTSCRGGLASGAPLSLSPDPLPAGPSPRRAAPPGVAPLAAPSAPRPKRSRAPDHPPPLGAHHSSRSRPTTTLPTPAGIPPATPACQLPALRDSTSPSPSRPPLSPPAPLLLSPSESRARNRLANWPAIISLGQWESLAGPVGAGLGPVTSPGYR